MSRGFIHFELKAEDFDKLYKAFMQLGAPLEKALDQMIYPGPAQRVVDRVFQYMPFSGRSAVGARVGGSQEAGKLSLGFYVGTKQVTSYARGNRYGYLFFPETGTGYTQKNTGAQRFFERAMEKETPGITEDVMQTTRRMLAEAGLI